MVRVFRDQVSKGIVDIQGCRSTLDLLNPFPVSIIHILSRVPQPSIKRLLAVFPIIAEDPAYRMSV